MAPGSWRRRPWRRHAPDGPTAFVLSGGGNLGAMQVGMLRALAEAGVVPDLLVGVSVGALNAAGFAASPDMAGVERLERLWRELTSEHIYPHSRLHGPWRYFQHRPSVYSADGLRRVISEFLPFRDLAGAAVPVHVVAAALPGIVEHWFDRGPAVEILAASAALPGVYPPVTLAGQQFIDGGVVDNVPLRRALDLGAQRVFVLLASAYERTWPDQPFRMILEAYSLARRALFLRDLAEVPPGVQVTVITPEPVAGLDFRDFSRTAELLAAGHRAAAASLAAGAPTTGGTPLALVG